MLIKTQFLSIKICMYFHVIGIKEDENKKYNIDIVLQSESDLIAKDFLHFHNIVILNFSDYKESPQSFWNIELHINHKQKIIKAFSYLNDIHSILKYFLMMWFDVSYVNFMSSENKLPEQEILELVKNTKIEVENIKETLKQELKQQKDQERKIYKDEKLKKTIKISLSAIKEIDFLLQNIDMQDVSQDKIRDIKLMSQELTKLKMWRNVDKMIEVLEKVYLKIYEIQKENFSKKTAALQIDWSLVTDVDINQEIEKYKKAQNIKKIWARRDNDDNYYLSFETTWIYLKFLFKDFKNSLNNISHFFYNIFGYFEIFSIFVVLTVSIYLRFSKISYSLYENLYLYYAIIQIWIFWLSFYIVKMFRKKLIKVNIVLLIIAFVVYYLLLWFFKNNLSF